MDYKWFSRNKKIVKKFYWCFNLFYFINIYISNKINSYLMVFFMYYNTKIINNSILTKYNIKIKCNLIYNNKNIHLLFLLIHRNYFDVS